MKNSIRETGLYLEEAIADHAHQVALDTGSRRSVYRVSPGDFRTMAQRLAVRVDAPNGRTSPGWAFEFASGAVVVQVVADKTVESDEYHHDGAQPEPASARVPPGLETGAAPLHANRIAEMIRGEPLLVEELRTVHGLIVSAFGATPSGLETGVALTERTPEPASALSEHRDRAIEALLTAIEQHSTSTRDAGTICLLAEAVAKLAGAPL